MLDVLLSRGDNIFGPDCEGVLKDPSLGFRNVSQFGFYSVLDHPSQT